jgi:hypothetical protein
LGFFCYGFKYLNDFSELGVSLTERPSVEGLEPNLFMVSSNKRGKHLNFSASRHTSSAFLQKIFAVKGLRQARFPPRDSPCHSMARLPGPESGLQSIWY